MKLRITWAEAVCALAALAVVAWMIGSAAYETGVADGMRKCCIAAPPAESEER